MMELGFQLRGSKFKKKKKKKKKKNEKVIVIISLEYIYIYIYIYKRKFSAKGPYKLKMWFRLHVTIVRKWIEESVMHHAFFASNNSLIFIFHAYDTCDF